MKIIDFLMNNIFIVVIIFGALASLFGKAGGKKKPSQMPDFGGGGLPRNLQPRTTEEPQRQSRPELQEQPEGQTVYRSSGEQDRQTPMQPSYVGTQTDVAAGASQTASLERALKRASTSKLQSQDALERKPAAQGALVTSVQAEDLRKAVIWAEVLGPPRSKKPFRK
ncbi:hypothetical protein [Paenibacillus luteus]|uniref:hypothetical protein n=1 Tax=Paenibacillus luteus TaxID=2545753 RepID=UPI0011428CCD|nr:hypothetical protein [Paenibacillus luteus]